MAKYIKLRASCWMLKYLILNNFEKHRTFRGEIYEEFQKILVVVLVIVALSATAVPASFADGTVYTGTMDELGASCTNLPIPGDVIFGNTEAMYGCYEATADCLMTKKVKKHFSSADLLPRRTEYALTEGARRFLFVRPDDAKNGGVSLRIGLKQEQYRENRSKNEILENS